MEAGGKRLVLTRTEDRCIVDEGSDDFVQSHVDSFFPPTEEVIEEIDLEPDARTVRRDQQKNP